MMGLKTVLLLSCLVVFAESSLLPRTLTLNECQNLNTCFAPVQSIGISPTSVAVMDKLKLPGALDNYCSSVPGIRACFETKSATCSALKEVANVETKVIGAEYVCDPNVRAKYLQIANMEDSCGRRNVDIMPEIDACSDQFKASVKALTDRGSYTQNDICPLVHVMGACMLRHVVNVCETEYVEFIDQYLIRVLNPLTADHFGCPPSSTYLQRLVRTVVEDVDTDITLTALNDAFANLLH